MKITVEKDNESKDFDIFTDEGFEFLSELWTKACFHKRIMYEPKWLGRPVIQLPNDIIMMQELIWDTRPDVIIETGIAHGGSGVFYASMLELLGNGRVIGIDIEIRKHNLKAIEEHPMFKRICLIEGSSTDPKYVKIINDLLVPGEKVLVVLDSNHSYEHVIEELNLYSIFVSPGSYIVVMDTVQELLSDNPTGRKEWKDDNPLRAVRQFLSDRSDWVVDNTYTRLGATCCMDGFLRKI